MPVTRHVLIQCRCSINIVGNCWTLGSLFKVSVSHPCPSQRFPFRGALRSLRAVARASLPSQEKIHFLRLLIVLCLVFWFNGLLNVSSSSIRGPAGAIAASLSEKCGFLFSEFVRTQQLTRWTRRSRKKTTKAKFFQSSILSLYSHVSSLFTCLLCTVRLNVLICIYWCLKLLLLLLLMGGVELNPGPVPEEEPGFALRSQNCRGLTDRNKLFKLLRQMYPPSKPSSLATISCLQETHCIDKFVLDHYFKGSSVIDNGERNQRGVCILVPDAFEICSSVISGAGRWGIAVIKAKSIQPS